MLQEYTKHGKKYIEVPWGGDTFYTFEIDEHIVYSAREDAQEPDRLKDVYIGSFVSDMCPEGVKGGARCCLKVINTDVSYVTGQEPGGTRENASIPIPSVREQYDLFPYRGEHFRRILVKNEDAVQIAGELRERNCCTSLETCCIVEPLYETLGYGDNDPGRGDARTFEMMTVWERLEYVRQFIEALTELQDPKNAIAGRQILAHRDVKVQNGLVERGYQNFKVILVDMASVLFDNETNRTFDPDEVVEVKMGQGPHGTGRGTLLSPANTPPELVLDRYSISEKADVFALGGILASMFGSCVRDGKFLDRNPICAFHYARHWPGVGQRNGRYSSFDAKRLGRNFNMGDFRERYTDNAAWDAREENQGKSWLEKDLEAHETPFYWGKEPGGSVEIPEDILKKVRALFIKCTRINPEHRLSLRRMKEEIEDLMTLVPEKHNYYNEKLYMAKEAVHLYDLACAAKKNLNYDLYTREAASIKRRAIRCDDYSIPGDGLYDGSGRPAFTRVFRDTAKLTQYVQDLNPSRRSVNGSLPHALFQLYRFYLKNYYVTSFDGEIRIFTNRGFDSKVWQDPNNLTCGMVLDALEELFEQNVEVRVYCPEEPTLQDERFRWEKTMVIGHGGSGPSKKPEAPKPPAADSYARGVEGLYFLDNGAKVYVSKKRR